MLSSLYFFGKNETGTQGKDILFNIMDGPTDDVAVKDNDVSALDGFVHKENEDWDQFFWSKFPLCVLFLERFVWNEDEEEMNVPPLGVL